MNTSMKRTLAIAAAAPLAVVGFAGAAAATQTGFLIRTQDINSVGTSVDECRLFKSFGPFFDIEIDRKGSGTGSNEFKIDSVTINAPDNQGSDDFDDPFARVEWIKVEYRNASDETFKTLTSHATARHGGEIKFPDDVTARGVKVTVKWYDYHEWDATSLKCTAGLPDPQRGGDD